MKGEVSLPGILEGRLEGGEPCGHQGKAEPGRGAGRRGPAGGVRTPWGEGLGGRAWWGQRVSATF